MMINLDLKQRSLGLDSSLVEFNYFVHISAHFVDIYRSLAEIRICNREKDEQGLC
jgi:hypothetical protein